MKRITALPLMIMFLLAGCYPSRTGNSSKSSFNQNKVIAHRGAWKNTSTPQNSMASLEHAFRLGCEGTEFDIRMTADDILVLNHDPHYQGLEVEKSTYEQLKAIPLKNGEAIPLLEDILRRGMQQQTTKLVAEIKPSPAGKERSLLMANKVVDLVQQLKADPWMVYISFDYDILLEIKKRIPDAPVQYLNGNVDPLKLKADGMDADYNQSVFQKDTTWIRRAHAAGIIVNAWTVNDSTVMETFLRQGMDLITTDEPEMLLRRVKALNARQSENNSVLIQPVINPLAQ